MPPLFGPELFIVIAFSLDPNCVKIMQFVTLLMN